jgi:hypothetical protein
MPNGWKDAVVKALEKLRRSFKKRKNLKYSLRILRLEPHPLSFYVDLLTAGTPFTFVRFGDGEWSAILGRSGANCDGHVYFPDLGRRLSSALADRYPYFYALQYYGLKNDGPAITDYLLKNRIGLPFHNADIFAFENVLGRLNPFIEALRKKQVVVIGPAHLRGVDRILPVARFFEVPSQNCFLAADEVVTSIAAWSKDKAGIVYAFSASMAAKVMIHDLYPALGKQNWLLDLGSIWDVYMGVKSRSWFEKLDLRPAMDRNTGVRSRGGFRAFRDRLILFVNRFHVRTSAALVRRAGRR